MFRKEYGEEAFCSAVFEWNKFAEGRDNLEDDEHTGQPRKVKNELKIQ
jgi:hypothetical protein